MCHKLVQRESQPKHKVKALLELFISGLDYRRRIRGVPAVVPSSTRVPGSKGPDSEWNSVISGTSSNDKIKDKRICAICFKQR
jgi:hypothetical protein